MNIVDAFINAAAVWFVLKAVEVIPFAIYDLFVLTKQSFSKTKDLPTYQSRHNHRFDKRRGKLDFIFSGTGFFQFSTCRRSGRLFLITSVVPIFIFVLEICSIFLGNETRTCQTSRDPNVIRAPSLQLFREGEREVSAIELNNEILETEEYLRPCLQRHWTYSGVEYVANMCSDLRAAISASIIANTTFPGYERMSLALPKAIENVIMDLVFIVVIFPFKNSLQDGIIIGTVSISCEVIVNGKAILRSEIAEGYVLDETMVTQIRNDVRILENAMNSSHSNFTELPDLIMFDSVGLDDFTKSFVPVARIVTHAVMSQSRRVGLKTAADLSILNAVNVNKLLREEVDISCEHDFFLPRTLSIIIIVTAAALRLLLIAVPTSLSSAEYALLHSEKEMNTALSQSSLQGEQLVPQYYVLDDLDLEK